MIFAKCKFRTTSRLMHTRNLQYVHIIATIYDVNIITVERCERRKIALSRFLQIFIIMQAAVHLVYLNKIAEVTVIEI